MRERSKSGADPRVGRVDVRRWSRRWPAEWEPHRATWLSWPHNIETWPGRLDAVEDAFVEMVRAILPGEGVRIHVQDDAMGARVRDLLRSAGVGDSADLEIYCVPTDDAWIRDHGGIFVLDEAEEGGSISRRILDFEFNAWGGKYPPWDLDARVAGEMARRSRVPSTRSPIIFEAGSIDGDGAGTLLTTESCLLNPNRAGREGQRSRASVEAFLADSFGARRVLWLGDGILGDDTDGHVDDLTRFVGPGRVVTAVCGDASDGNFAALAENRRRLESMTDAAGCRLEVIELPMPDPLFGPDGRLPASYSNFYFANHAVLVPTFGVDQDAEALSILEAAVPDRAIVPIPSQDLVLGLGAVHCLTQQEPVAPSS